MTPTRVGSRRLLASLIRDEEVDNRVAPADDLGLEVLLPGVGQKLLHICFRRDALQDVAQVELHVNSCGFGGLDQARHDRRLSSAMSVSRTRMPSLKWISLTLAASALLACEPAVRSVEDSHRVHLRAGRDTGYGLPDLFGTSIAGLGDIDGDGLDDFAVGDPALSIVLGSGALAARRGRIHVFRGSSARSDGGAAEFQHVHSLEGREDNDGFGTTVVGRLNLDGDGTPDFVVGAAGGRGEGYVRAYAGSSFEALWTRDVDADGIVVRRYLCGVGPRIARVPDIDGDGLSELAVLSAQMRRGAPEQPGQLALLSGKDGATIWTLGADDTIPMLGGGLVVVDDVDGDGKRDLAVGATDVRDIAERLGHNDRLRARDPGRPGEVLVVSSSSGGIIRRIKSPRGGQMFGFSLANSRDWDGDGTHDILVSEAFEYPYSEGGGENEVVAISPTTGNVLKSWKGPVVRWASAVRCSTWTTP